MLFSHVSRFTRYRVMIVVFVLSSIFLLHNTTAEKPIVDINNIYQGRKAQIQSLFGVEDHCKGWDPKNNATMDPVNCFRARQYRQVEAVLTKLQGWPAWFYEPIVETNFGQLRECLRCFLPDDDPLKKSCPPRPMVVIGYPWTWLAFNGAVSGEAIWQLSVLEVVRELGYTHLIAGGRDRWMQAVQMMPDVYHSIWIDDNDLLSCLGDPRCIEKDHYVPPAGTDDLSLAVPDEERGTIPLYAMFDLTYWGCRPREYSPGMVNLFHIDMDGIWSSHPLGLQWIGVPFDMPDGHVHLPYSLESACAHEPITAPSERNNSVLVLAKVSSYFYGPYAPPADFYKNLTRDSGLTIVSAAKVEDDYPLPEGVIGIGQQTREDYRKLVGSVKALLGIGFPTISPSVYTALCKGTPSVLPMFRDGVDPEFKGWSAFADHAQHGPAQRLGAPYVYSYGNHNYTTMLEQVTAATSAAIGRYIPPDMRIASVTQELKRFLERDLKSMFHAVLEANGGRIPAVRQKMYARCRELGHCTLPLAEGTIPLEPGRPLDWKQVDYRKSDTGLTQEQLGRVSKLY